MMSASPLPSTGLSLRILVVDDSDSVRAHLCALLESQGHRTLPAADASEGLSLFESASPDLVFTDISMPGHDGYWLAREIRTRERGHWTPVIFLSSLSHETDLAQGIEAGGDDYLVKPVHPVVLAAKLLAMQRLAAMQQRLEQLSAELRAANHDLQRQVECDALTGLANRRGLDARLDVAIRTARRSRQPLTVMLCDLDHFKGYNDAVGHAGGDACLRRVGELLKGTARRPQDVAARYGGEEFALILPETPRSGAMMLARAVSRVFRAAAMPHPCSPVAPYVTISGGITTFIPDDSTTPDGMLRRADEALYVAKAKGRNRFFSFETQLDSEERDGVASTEALSKPLEAAEAAMRSGCPVTV